MNNILLENYIVQFLNEATRDERFQELVEILKSKKVQDGDATQKLVIFDKIYKDLLRASRYRNSLHSGSFNQLKNIIQSSENKNNIADAIKYFKTKIESLPDDERISSGSWFQINLNNTNANRSITRGQLDDEEAAQKKASHVLRTHQMYFTFQYENLQFDKSLSKKTLKKAFGEHIKNFADAMIDLKDFAEINNASEKIKISEFKTLNILNYNIDDFLNNNRNSFVKYYTDADNLKVYLTGADRGQKDLMDKKRLIYSKVIEIFENKGFVNVQRERQIFGVDFDIIRPDKSIHRTSFGALTAYALMNNLFKSEAERNKIISGGQSKFWKLVSKVENWLNDPSNSTTIAKIISNPLNSTYFNN